MVYRLLVELGHLGDFLLLDLPMIINFLNFPLDLEADIFFRFFSVFNI